MRVPKPARSPKLASVVGAALALVAVGAAVTLKRYASRPRLANPEAHAAADDAPLSSVERLRALDGGRFYHVCTAFYESRQFHLRGARTSGGAHEADLYFGTLPQPVAIVRVIASGGKPVDVDAVQDLPQLMSRHRVGKAIVHVTGRYTDAAIAFARGARIRLVSGADLVRNVEGMREDVRRALSETLLRGGEPQRELHDAVLH